MLILYIERLPRWCPTWMLVPLAVMTIITTMIMQLTNTTKATPLPLWGNIVAVIVGSLKIGMTQHLRLLRKRAAAVVVMKEVETVPPKVLVWVTMMLKGKLRVERSGVKEDIPVKVIGTVLMMLGKE